jgi:hypothetical protein
MAGLPPGLAAYQAKHKSGSGSAIQRRLASGKPKIIDPDIPNSGDEYQIINGKKVMVKSAGKKAASAGKSNNLPPWLKK